MLNSTQKKTCGQGINNIFTWRIRKEKLAYDRQKAEHIEKGLICVWSCLETVHHIKLCTAGKQDTPIALVAQQHRRL